MHADYVPNPLYDNNPFIEALPPMLSGKDLIRALAVIPPYSDSDRDRSTGERLQLLSSLYEFYQPLSMTIDLYCEIYTAMQHCYGQYSIQSEAAAMQNHRAADDAYYSFFNVQKKSLHKHKLQFRNRDAINFVQALYWPIFNF